MSDDDPTLVISQFGNSLLEIIVIGEALQRGIFDGENLTLKLGSIQGDMAAGPLMVVGVLLASPVDGQVAPVVGDFDFYGFGGELILDFHIFLSFLCVGSKARHRKGQKNTAGVKAV